MTTSNTTSLKIELTPATLESATRLHLSNDKGQGNSHTLPQKLEMQITDSGNVIFIYCGTFKIILSPEQYTAISQALILKEFASKNTETLERWCNHLSSGNYLSLNHTDGKTVKTQLSVWQKLFDYHVLFSTLGITDAQSNGKGSKMTRLICKPTNATIEALTKEGFTNISPIVEGLEIIGLKCELPDGV